MSRSAAAAFGEVPSGFSFDESFTNFSKPYFLRACDTVVPGVYGFIDATSGRTSLP